ncbi:hypothetical protein D9M72_254130 [compost metagenome]
MPPALAAAPEPNWGGDQTPSLPAAPRAALHALAVLLWRVLPAPELPVPPVAYPSISDQMPLAHDSAYTPSSVLGASDSPPEPGTVSMVFCAAS